MYTRMMITEAISGDQGREYVRKAQSDLIPLIGNSGISYETLETMRSRGGKWAAYQNHDLGSAQIGHLQFLQYGGPDSTFATPPYSYPDTPSMIGWRYLHAGFVDLQDGVIVTQEQEPYAPVKEVRK